MQYTLRNVPKSVDKAIRTRAKKEGRSLNDVALEALMRGVGIGSEVMKNHDLDFLIGTWVEDPEFDKVVEDMRRIDPEMWNEAAH